MRHLKYVNILIKRKKLNFACTVIVIALVHHIFRLASSMDQLAENFLIQIFNFHDDESLLKILNTCMM